ncbi:hypothetical protein [Streptomyces sp. NBC_00503]|uniref:hypothetical protein n=1 Tax=Streptomyces sp. NBC_00503 TaxID=2903659 RepID=UPI002E80FE83|nr:hypothetical protein [Streptomyces sp. NBC_00503]WUD81056.1 hypothetical protein OG490_11140 [Streptomyces sp. NBC_00503]
MATVVGFGLAMPQASAAEGPSSAGVPVARIAGVAVSPRATASTLEVAAANPQAVQATATLCGAGYNLFEAVRLPDASRKGTLFTYNTADLSGTCAVFDNNLATSKYMKLKLCENKIGGKCSIDEGNFTQYAGPVKITGSYVFCAPVTAIMKDSASSSKAIIDFVAPSTPCN